MTEIPTPRTDAYVRENFTFGPPAHADFARQLERELGVLREVIGDVASSMDNGWSDTLWDGIDKIDAMRRAFEEGR